MPRKWRETMKKYATAAIAALSVAATLAVSAGTAEAKFGRKGALFGGIAAGLVGAAILSQSARGHAAPSYGDCWTEKRPRYDRWGDFRGYRYIRVCN